MDCYIGEIRLLAFGKYAPANFLPCDGKELSIGEYPVLHAVIGTTYGGNGKTTFCLPDLRGRSPVHTGTIEGGGTYTLGRQAGAEQVTVATANIPAHTHTVSVSKTKATQMAPGPTRVHGDVAPNFLYCSVSQSGTIQDLSSDTVTPSQEGGQPHNNIQPSLGLQYVICVNGLYPDFD